MSCLGNIPFGCIVTLEYTAPFRRRALYLLGVHCTCPACCRSTVTFRYLLHFRHEAPCVNVLLAHCSFWGLLYLYGALYPHGIQYLSQYSTFLAFSGTRSSNASGNSFSPPFLRVVITSALSIKVLNLAVETRHTTHTAERSCSNRLLGRVDVILQVKSS